MRAHRRDRLLRTAARWRRRLTPELGIVRWRIALRGAVPRLRLKPPLQLFDLGLVCVDGPERIGRLGFQLHPEPLVMGAQPAPQIGFTAGVAYRESGESQAAIRGDRTAVR